MMTKVNIRWYDYGAEDKTGIVTSWTDRISHEFQYDTILVVVLNMFFCYQLYIRIYDEMQNYNKLLKFLKIRGTNHDVQILHMGYSILECYRDFKLFYNKFLEYKAKADISWTPQHNNLLSFGVDSVDKLVDFTMNGNEFDRNNTDYHWRKMYAISYQMESFYNDYIDFIDSLYLVLNDKIDPIKPWLRAFATEKTGKDETTLKNELTNSTLTTDDPVLFGLHFYNSPFTFI